MTGIRQKVAAAQLGRAKPHQCAGGKQLIPVFYDPSHATTLLEHIHAKPRLRGQPRARNVYPPSLETGDLGHHICIHKSTSSTIERHSQNHMESMKLSHPLSSLAPYAAGQEQERKEKTAAPLMHPSQRISRGIKWVKASTSPCPKARGLWRRTIPLLSGITIISAGHGV